MYLSIDIETTGLNPATCQILEIGAVAFNRDGVVAMQSWLVKQDLYRGEAYALHMNASLLLECDKGGEPLFNVLSSVAIWARGLSKDKITVCGKNYGMFDVQFLGRPFHNSLNARHRIIDVGTLCMRPTDEYPPDLAECKKRYGVEGVVSHRALGDAMDVAEIVMRWLNGQASN